MKNSINKIESEFKLIKSWNLTHKQKVLIYYPENERELKKILKYIKKNKKTFIIKTGSCSYDGKSISPKNSNIAISLKNFNKLTGINKKKNTVNVQAGTKIVDLLFDLKRENLSMFSVPGGVHITVGGAISANVIGKDSSKNFGSFGDSVKSLKIMTHNGIIKNFKSNSKNFSQFIGSFGFFGIILSAEIKLKKIESQNLILICRKINSYSELQIFLNKKVAYKYVQIDPFLRKSNLGIFFYANFIKEENNIHKIKNFNIYFFEIIFFKLFAILNTQFSWKIFNKLLFFLNRSKSKKIDIHNFFYSSKYKDMVPYLCKDGHLEYEILVKGNLIKILKKFKELFSTYKFYPYYIIIKKLYKSQKNYFYSFNNNGYSLGIAFDRKNINMGNRGQIENFIKKNNLKINMGKTDSMITNKFDKKTVKKIRKSEKNSFMSIFKSIVLNNLKN